MQRFSVLRTFSITLSWFPWVSSPLMPHAIALSAHFVIIIIIIVLKIVVFIINFCCFHWGLWILSFLVPKHLAIFCNFPQNCCFCSRFYWGLWTLSYCTSCHCPLQFFVIVVFIIVVKVFGPFHALYHCTQQFNFWNFHQNCCFRRFQGGLWTHSCLFPLHSAIFFNCCQDCCLRHFLHSRWGLWTLSCKCYLSDNLHTATLDLHRPNRENNY